MMNLRRKNAAAALCLLAGLAVFSAACGKKNTEETDSVTAAETATVSEAETASGTENAEEEPTLSQPQREMDEIQSEEPAGILTGTVEEAAMNTLVIVNADYPDGVTFSKEDAAVGLKDGLELDSEVTVFYMGTLGKDGKLENGDVPAAELVRDARDGDGEREAGVISGKVLGMGMSVLTIQTEDGQEISFEQDPKPVNLTDGPADGEEVHVLYSNEKDVLWYVPELIWSEAETQ